MILEKCKGVHCVDLDESFQTHIYLQNFFSIQPRTSPVKFAADLQASGRHGTHVTIFWNLSRNPDKISSKILGGEAPADQAVRAGGVRGGAERRVGYRAVRPACWRTNTRLLLAFKHCVFFSYITNIFDELLLNF